MNRITKILIMFWIIIFITFNIYAEELKLQSEAAILIEKESGRVLFEKNSRERRKIASLTKIMTAIVAVENCNMEEMTVIGKNPAMLGGSVVGLKYNSKVSLENLMYGMLLKSGNDCALAIAEHVAGNKEEFSKLMNEKAKDIGAKDTFFTNPHGLDTEENYSTAYDIALITKYALNNKYITNILNTNNITLDFGGINKNLTNTNRLLRTTDFCVGGKTGFTNGANRCLMAVGKKNNMTLIAIILGAETTDIRFNEAKKLLEYGLNNYKMQDISSYMNWYINIDVYKGNVGSYTKNINNSIILPLKEGELQEIYIMQNLVPSLKAPVKKGAYLGNVEMYIGKEKIYDENIYLEEEITKKTVKDYIEDGIKNIFNIKLEFGV